MTQFLVATAAASVFCTGVVLVFSGVTMPTNAELAKRIEALEESFNTRVARAVEAAVSTALSKLHPNPASLNELSSNAVAECQEGMPMLNDLVEQMKTELQQLKDANKNLAARNEELESKVAELQQYSAGKRTSRSGKFRKRKGKKFVAIVKTIAQKIGSFVSEADLDIVHRVPAKGNVKNLIVRFCSRAKKAEFVAKARKARV